MYDNQAALSFYLQCLGSPQRKSINSFVDAVISISDIEDMSLFLEGYIMFLIQEHPERELAKNVQIARNNIGYCFGEGMPISKKVLWKSIGVSHPLFKSLDPSPEEAFKAGVQWGERMQFEKEIVDAIWEELEEAKRKKNV